MAGLPRWALTDIQVARKRQFIYLFSFTLRIWQQAVLWFDGGVFASPVVGVSARCTDTCVQVIFLISLSPNPACTDPRCDTPDARIDIVNYFFFTFCGWFYHKLHCLSLPDTFSLIQIIILSNGRNIIHSCTSSSDLVVAQAAVHKLTGEHCLESRTTFPSEDGRKLLCPVKM